MDASDQPGSVLESIQGLPGVEYVRALQASGLLQGTQLERAVAQLISAIEAGKNSDDTLAEILTSHHAITAWQARTLRRGLEHGFFLGRYKLLDEIGRGGMGRVYLAEHELMRRRVAIKVVACCDEISTRMDRFLIETRAAASLDHPHIVRVFHFDQEQGVLYLVMEYVQGEDFKRLVDREGPLEYRRAADFIRQAALGLGYLHAHGLVHRDVKPGNLLVGPQECVKILDLGLARFTSGEYSITADSRMLGTADFIAPEQVRNSHRVDSRADLYSLGGTLYYLLTGQPPFAGCEVFERLHKHLYDQPRDIRLVRPDAPLALIEMCTRLMSKEPQDRPQEASEVAATLARWLQSPTGAPATLAQQPARVIEASGTAAMPGLSSDEATEKAQAVARLAGGVAHRLNNLLQSIEGGASLAMLDLRVNEEARASLAEIEAGIRAAADLTEQLLIVAGRAAFHPAPIRVGELVEEASRWISASAPSSVEVRCDVALDLPLVQGDASHLRRMLLNLCSNARDALSDRNALSDRKGVITLQAATAPSSAGVPQVQITVGDDGPGIDAGSLSRIFDPFFSTRGRERGLGLAVAQGIAAMHGGRIEAQSKPGHGALFRVSFAACEPAKKTSDTPNKRTLLVVDDDDQLRDVTRRLLSRLGYEVLTAKDGREALELFRQEGERIDLVLMDQCMPGLSGERTLEEIRLIRPDARAILSSGSADQATLNRVAQGHVGFIQKPYQTATLVREVQRQLEEPN